MKKQLQSLEVGAERPVGAAVGLIGSRPVPGAAGQALAASHYGHRCTHRHQVERPPESGYHFAFDATYFFTPHVAVNVLATFINLGVKTKSGALASGFGTDSLGSVDVLPPIVNLPMAFYSRGEGASLCRRWL